MIATAHTSQSEAFAERHRVALDRLAAIVPKSPGDFSQYYRTAIGYLSGYLIARVNTNAGALSADDYLAGLESAVACAEEQHVRRAYEDWAVYGGFMPGACSVRGFVLVTLRKPVGKHPAGSTIALPTLEKLLAV